MKELTIEEKAKRYDEALERTRELATDLPNGRNDRLYHIWDLEAIFPELKESEEEKIKRELIEMVKLCTDSDDVEKKIAWLEKQGEQKSNWSEEDENMIRGLIAICDEWVGRHSYYPVENCDIEMLKNWLKSLKERYTWKPSEEQMDALYTYIYNPQYFSSPDPRMELVESVYRDLKKLKG